MVEKHNGATVYSAASSLRGHTDTIAVESCGIWWACTYSG